MTPAPWRFALERQLLAAIDALESAMRACPPQVWVDDAAPVERRSWYLAYHTLFWLDRDLTPTPEQHLPPLPYTMSELDPEGSYPEHPYSLEQLLEYLAYDRAKARARLAALDDETASAASAHRPELSVLEFLIHSTRHVQHHTAQLNLIVRQAGMQPGSWVVGGPVAKRRA